MKLNESSLRWSINHLLKESDNDLFPRPFELSIVNEFSDDIIALCKEIDITSYKWKPSRRFLIPKDDISFRNATQLDLVDSILIGAIIKEFGQGIEDKRIPESEHKVFSYRFKPLADGTLYGNKKAWEQFWISCKREVDRFDYVVMCDISDFYNQISLHTIENQLAECGFPAPVARRVKDLIVSITQRSSKGIPIGPHTSHLLAEMTLIPFDDHLNLLDIEFKRYVDDIIIFCHTEKEARVKLNKIADILDKEQRLVLQKLKTRIISKDDFVKTCKRNLLEEVAYSAEEEIIEIINSYTGGEAYAKVKLSTISDEDMAKLSEENILTLLSAYLKSKPPNYEKLRWLYRRLSQIGLPYAIDFSIDNFDKLIPAINDVCLYINSCAENYSSDWKEVGEFILDVLDDEIVESNEFYVIALYNLFVYNRSLNHISTLLGKFSSASENVKRKILLASMNYDSASWLRSLKEQSVSFQSWTRRAFLMAASKLPAEEKEYFLKGLKATLQKDDILEHIIIKWASK
jgi:retron-type reverse transcriptase